MRSWFFGFWAHLAESYRAASDREKYWQAQISTRDHRIESLERQLKLAANDIKTLTDINTRNGERISWETKQFARLGAEAEHGEHPQLRQQAWPTS